MSYWPESRFYDAQYNLAELRKECEKLGSRHEADLVLLDRIEALLKEFGERTGFPYLTAIENAFCHDGGEYGVLCWDGLACEERCAEKVNSSS